MSIDDKKSELSPATQYVDMVTVATKRTSCDGGGGALGHPKVWLDMGEDTQVECKYCDKLFVLSPDAAPGHH